MPDNNNFGISLIKIVEIIRWNKDQDGFDIICENGKHYPISRSAWPAIEDTSTIIDGNNCIEINGIKLIISEEQKNIIKKFA